MRKTCRNKRSKISALESLPESSPTSFFCTKKAHFSKHIAIRKKYPGMYGTLVICLPSEHTSGEVLLVHSSNKREIATSPSSAYNLSAAAWYSDVQHEIKPVTSGYRLVLTHNLIQDPGLPMQMAARLDTRHAQLRKLLRRWLTDYLHLKYLIYPLEHQYTQSSLSLSQLKGHDAAKGHYLEHLCSENGFY